MSLDHIHADATNDAPKNDEDEHRLDAVVANLNSRVTAFEQSLESAVQTEKHFRSNIQALLDSLDTFVERHVEKDRLLTQLIEEDTQRSKEAKEEYDALASRFDHNLRKDNLTHTRDWLRTVSVYAGIVLSVVLMAPLHAFWWLLTRTLTRIGLLKSSEEPIIYPNVRRRGRYTSSASERSQAGTRHRRRSSDANVPAPQGSKAPQFSSTLRRNEDIKASMKEFNSQDSNDITMEGLKVDANVPHAQESSDSERCYTSRDQVSEGDGTGLYRENVHQPETESDGEDEFFDARNDLQERVEYSERAKPGQTEETTQEKEEINVPAEDVPERPGWALPAGSDETLPDMSSFPSSEFWEISDEDIRLEVPPSDKISD